jgi:hypothetical protein
MDGSLRASPSAATMCNHPHVETAVDAPPRPSQLRRWAAVLVLVVVVAGALTARALLADEGPGTMEEQVAARLVTMLEQASPAEHADHGHHFDIEGGGVLCAADPFGYEPADATTVDEVRVVYAHHLCAVLIPDTWQNSLRASGPVRADFTTTPPTVQTPESDDYPGWVRETFPAQYHDVAVNGFLSDEVVDRMRERFADRRPRS